MNLENSARSKCWSWIFQAAFWDTEGFGASKRMAMVMEKILELKFHVDTKNDYALEKGKAFR